ncbi:NifB/NifX family molybdenum-iron cluster-binding protein [Vibrio sp. MA40-2]|uniref:NifB/NifX family molybdenum-iron cluster-binding protein n=1 Tax=Vibrio sp. MA40-2 TaxID=3391828 RepID=UPI0039A48891
MIASERKLHIESFPTPTSPLHKVAFATGDRQHVDQHFGTAKSFLIYGVNRDRWQIQEAIEYPVHQDNVHDKLSARIEDLSECIAVYCIACGAAAIRKLLEHEVHPVKVIESAEIKDLLHELQQELQGEPTGWLGRAVKEIEQNKQGVRKDRLAELMDEDW